MCCIRWDARFCLLFCEPVESTDFLRAAMGEREAPGKLAENVACGVGLYWAQSITMIESQSVSALDRRFSIII